MKIPFIRKDEVNKNSSFTHRRRYHWGTGEHVPLPQDFAINKEEPFLLLENAPFFLRKKVPSNCRAPSKFEMLPTQLCALTATVSSLCPPSSPLIFRHAALPDCLPIFSPVFTSFVFKNSTSSEIRLVSNSFFRPSVKDD